ncbi:SIR2 family protein [Acinetobacter nosocomialis]|uniref:SIR2 family protein n=1 Tax=Acinetobacter nosocomialis TaxID=106654 RepID=UPI0024DE7E7B|nr:SIR2 family protein [Acinetobacter nosocomialis]
MNTTNQRALIVMGAGASVEYGIPITSAFTNDITDKINNNDYFKKQGITEVYNYVKDTLVRYYQNEGDAHFERIYHALHELNAHHYFEGAIAKFSPVMAPFFETQHTFSQIQILGATKAIIEIIYTQASTVCDTNTIDLAPLKNFFDKVQQQYVPRVYTTNYDNFIHKATEGKYFTGFTRKLGDLNLFDGKSFFEHWNDPSLFYLHGSVHMGFPPPFTPEIEIGDITWFEDTSEALRHAFITASGVPRMDGSTIERTSIITGLEKLGRLQQTPYAYYYSEFSRDAMAADVIFVIGSGLADLHINKWILEARLANPETPIVFVGYWKDGEMGTGSDLEISLTHDLRIEVFGCPSDQQEWNDWTIFKKNNAAVWKRGFQSFLNQNDDFNDLLNQIKLN